MARVLVIGSAHLDVIGEYQDIRYVDRKGKVTYSIGGTAYNIAVDLAQHRVRCFLFTYLKKNSILSRIIWNKLALRGVKRRYVRSVTTICGDAADPLPLAESGFVAHRDSGLRCDRTCLGRAVIGGRRRGSGPCSAIRHNPIQPAGVGSVGGSLYRRSAAPSLIVVHSLVHAIAALEAAAELGRPVTILSAPNAGIYGGPGWFKALIDAARTAVPTADAVFMLHCGDDAGAAQSALRAGIETVIFTGRADVAERLASIAYAKGGRLLTTRPEASFDLGRWFFADAETLRRHCAARLA